MKLTSSSPTLTAIIFCILLSCSITISIAQINVEHLGSGDYKYTSLLPDSDLHFYLFDDGYHSFKKSPKHQFANINVPANPVFYTANPYDNDPPPELSIGGGNIGAQNPIIVQEQMDNKVQLKRSWNLVEGEDNYYILMFENRENYTVDGCVEFHYNDKNNNIAYGDILDHYNNWVTYENHGDSSYENEGYSHRFKWSFTNLEPDEQRFIYIPAKCKASVFKAVDNLAVIKTNCNITPPIHEENGSSNQGNSDTYVLTSIVSNNPHDPNCIVPQCVDGNESQYLEEGFNLKYRIYFQNDGEDPVVNVRINTNFNFNFENITLLGASHNCTFVGTNNDVNILFPNIYLPGTGSITPVSYEKTVGWVDFIVCFSSETFQTFLQGSECIVQEGVIRFDSEAPIGIYDRYCRENWRYCIDGGFADIRNHICNSSSSGEQIYIPEFEEPINYRNRNDREIKLYPNPVNNLLTIDIKSDYSNSQLVVYDINGKSISITQKINKQNNFSIDVSHLASGVYFISITTDNGITNTKFVKN